MNTFGERDDLPPELEDVASRLREQRPRLSGLELDQMQTRILARSASPARSTMTWRSTLKSRFAIVLMLVFGGLFTTTGASLAVTSLAQNTDAGEVQYRQSDDATDVLGEVGTVEEDTAPAPTADPAPVEQTEAPAQAPQQVAATQDGDSLPFTGFTAIPVLLLGIALLSTGVLLRRKTGRENAG
jgi:hypothetical protein